MRRSSSILAVFFVALPLFAQTQTFPAPWPTPPANPDAYWQTLMTGNKTGTINYMAGALPYTGLAARRTDTVGSQNPPVTVLSCADSRVPPELIFGRTVGDLFVVRVAGNVASQFDIASIEYAITPPRNWTKLIVVMGHQNCGAVVEALKTEDPGTPSLVALVQRIRESFIGWQTWPATEPAADRLERGTKANARGSAAYLLAHSTIIRQAVLEHRVGLVVAYYKLGSGEVEVVQP
jgi:carbonic anhydrase